MFDKKGLLLSSCRNSTLTRFYLPLYAAICRKNKNPSVTLAEIKRKIEWGMPAKLDPSDGFYWINGNVSSYFHHKEIRFSINLVNSFLIGIFLGEIGEQLV